MAQPPHFEIDGATYFVTTRLKQEGRFLAKQEAEIIVEPHGHSPWHPTSRSSGATSRPNACAFIHGQSPWPSAAGVNTIFDRSTRKEMTLYAYVIMSNHIHILIKPIICGFYKGHAAY